MNKEIPSFSIKDLFEKNDSYIIPIYQRNYTWGQGEIIQLIQDISDFAFDSKKQDNNYYIGTLVVYERHIDNQIIYETIDGQQRLTTLNILLNAIHRMYNVEIGNEKINYQLNLSFDSRKKSTDTLSVISNQSLDIVFLSNKEYNSNIKQRYFDAEKILKQFSDDGTRLRKFYKYLTEKVRIVRVSVPEETDLNHYFEIMNNRGEQLEKHEILKAKMLEVIKEDKDISFAFNLIWEACSDMERYVQYGFSVEQRNRIFTSSNWNDLCCSNLDEIAAKLIADDSEKAKSNNDSEKQLSINKIIEFKGSFETNTNQTDDSPERFNSVINFANFLLHVLRIQTKTDISLDDKRLIDFFDEYLKSDNSFDEKLKFVKKFGYSLLRTKYLFDQYIIKREFIREKDQWSLKKLKWYTGTQVSYVNTFEENDSINKNILMLLAMFHVSTPTLVYKHWLNAALFHLYYSEKISYSSYLSYLENLAKSYLYDRYIAKKEFEVDYYDIIYSNFGLSVNLDKNSNFDFNNLDRGTSVENFVFNYLDYILWKNNSEGSSTYEFSFNSSVEHYYPQNPISSEHKIPSSIYDLFGNLCLISSSKNSRLSNHMPEAKKDFYYKVGSDSLKQRLMMNISPWEETEIKLEGEKMKQILINHNI
jgi:hypothetical protein